MKIVCIIPARGGSTRLPNKNIFPIWGKPMLFWAWKACKESTYDIDVYVSTDSDEIEDVCLEYGINVIRRPTYLGGDKVYKQEVIRWTAQRLLFEEYSGKNIDVDYWISLQPNSPEIHYTILDSALQKMIYYNKDELVSVSCLDDGVYEQNAGFRIFKGEYVFQRDLSTNLMCFEAKLMDVHTKNDVEHLEIVYGSERGV